MNRLGELIYQNDFEYKLYAVSMRDKATTRISIDTYIVSPDDEMSDLITIQKKDIFGKAKWADVFQGLDADFSRDDIDNIKSKLMNFIRQNKNIDVQSRATPAELYRALSDFIKLKDGKEYTDTSLKVLGTFTKNGYGYIDSHMMEEFVKSHKDMGYKKLDILKRLKIMGVLECTKNRPYDILISIGGEKRRFYKILLEKESMEEEPCEVYELPTVKAPEEDTEAVETHESI